MGGIDVSSIKEKLKEVFSIKIHKPKNPMKDNPFKKEKKEE